MKIFLTTAVTFVIATSVSFSFGAGAFAQDAPPVAEPALTADVPVGTLVQAETGATAQNVEVVADAGALDDHAVALRKEWERIAVPVPQGTAFKIWVRYHNGPLALKGTGGGAEKELKWNYDNPSRWAWTDFGTYSRDDLGDSILLMREKQNDKSDPIVDAVVFTPDKVRPLPPFEPDAATPPLHVNASIDWNQRAGYAKSGIWGTNDYEILDPQKAADPGLGEFLRQTNFSLVRIHEGGITDRWTNGETRTWDVEKIKAGFAGTKGYNGANVMLNIARWPGWLQGGDYLPPEKTEEFVQLVGQLVDIMRDQVKQPITYWELPNEKEAAYEKLGKMDELYDLYNRLALEIKKQDPQAKVGGPAMSWPNPKWVDGFLKNCAANADFISYHNYGSGDIYDSNEELFTKPAAFESSAKAVSEAIKKYVPNRPFQMFLTEYNVEWTWTPFERRQANNVGAVFMASTMKHLAQTDLDGVMLWQLKGYYYGMIDDDNAIRPAAQLYQWGNRYMVGDIAKSDSADERLEIMPVTRKDGARSVLIINKAAQTIIAPSAAALLPSHAGESVWQQQISATGKGVPAATTPGDLTLPGYSVTLLSVGAR